MIEDTRRAPRRAVPEHVPVTDRMREQVIGRLGNVSESGMLILSDAELVDDALYQLRFLLEDGGAPQPIEVGAHLLWLDRASAPAVVWAGFRFIAVVEDHARRLRAWVEAPGSHYE